MAARHRTAGGGGGGAAWAGRSSPAWGLWAPVAPLPVSITDRVAGSGVAPDAPASVRSSVAGPERTHNCSIHAAPTFFSLAPSLPPLVGWPVCYEMLTRFTSWENFNRTCLLTCVASVLKSHHFFFFLYETRRDKGGKKKNNKMHTSWNVQYNLGSGLTPGDRPHEGDAVGRRLQEVDGLCLCPLTPKAAQINLHLLSVSRKWQWEVCFVTMSKKDDY